MSYSIPEDVAVLENLVVHLATLYDLDQECVDFDGNIVEDSEYDLLYRTLKDRKPDSEAFAKGVNSPSKVDPVGDNLVIHHPPMTSIAKADGDFTQKMDIYKNWLATVEKRLGHTPDIVQSFKHDGVAISIVYKNGKLHEAGMRPRNGVKGINVTANVQYVNGVPTELPLPISMTIRGELECLRDDFQKVQDALEEAGEDLRANPRNHTAGSINQQKDPKKTKDGRITFCGYNVVGFDDADKHYKTRREMAIWVNKTLGIPFVRVEPHKFNDLGVMEQISRDLPYETDGIVLQVDNLEDYEQLGHHGDDPVAEPHGALAWKFEEERVQAIVNHLEWNASRTGRVTPVAVFNNPVKLAGTMVRRATCSNLGWVSRMRIGQGTGVAVYKAGKIIPKIECVIFGGVSEVDHPNDCPTCKTPLVIETNTVKMKGETIVNEDLVCKNLECAAKHVEGIAFYLKTMEAKGLGASKIERIVAGGKVKELPDIYTLTVQDLIEAELSPRESILAVATIQHVKPSKDDDKMSMDILAAKARKKKVQGWQVFAALGISGAGKTVGKALFDHLKTMEAIMDASVDDLMAIPGIGDTTAESIIAYFAKHKPMVQRLLEHVEPEGPKVGGKMEGKTFCLSGGFDKGKSYWEQLITEASGKVSGSVGKKTSYLVAGPGSGSKSTTAQSLNIPIITETELEAMFA